MKRFLSFLLIVAVLSGFVVLPASAETEAVTGGESCPHCNTLWDNIEWEIFEPFDSDNPAYSGHFYLAEDTLITSMCGLGAEDGQGAEYAVDVCLDLRGFDLVRTAANARAIYVYDYSRFSVMDTVGGGRLSAASTVLGGTVYIAKDAQFHLYSGTVCNTTTSAARTSNGGVVYGTQGSFIYIHGGIIDATAVKANVSSGTPRGGAIYAGGECEISGGLILGGYMYQGGSVSIGSKGTLRMSGGTVYGGEASSYGGNLHNYGDAYISGGELLGGISGSYGGNIYSNYSSGGLNSDLHISGGYIADGQAVSAGNNIALTGGNGSVTGGHIKGDFYVNASIVLSGSPVIDNYGYEGLYVATNKKIVIRDLADDARVLIRSSGTITDASASPDAPQYLANGQLAAASRYSLTASDGVLIGGQDDEGYCPHCQKDITWVAYTADTNTSGHYYIPSGGIVPNAAALTIAEGTDMVINLSNGNIQAAAAYDVSGSLTLLSTASSKFTVSNTNSASSRIMRVSGTLNLYDCYLEATTTTISGAALYLTGGNLNMYGGWITGGDGKNGGNLYCDKGSVIRMDGGVIKNGIATGSGGNIFLDNSTLNLNAGVIYGGYSKTNGGNIQLSAKGKLNMEGGLLLRGETVGNGGNIYSASTNSEMNLRSGVIFGGSAKNGGNIYANNGIAKLTGGSVLSGEATSSGGNIYTIVGKYFITNNGDLTKNYFNIGDNNIADEIPAPVISGGRGQYGGNLFLGGISTMGAVTLSGGRADSGQALYLGEYGRLTVEPDFTGTHKIALHSTRITELREQSILSYCTSSELNAELYVENYDMAMLVSSDGNLGMAGASLVSIADGSQVWYETAQEAVDHCTAGEYVRLYSKGNTVTLSGDTVMDVNGCDVTVQGAGKLYGFDSRNDTYETFAVAALAGVTAEPMFHAPNGNTYVAVTDSQGTSFHRVSTRITDVVLRPSVAGLYYKAQFLCDEKLASFVDAFGIAVSLQDDPAADFTTDTDTLYTTFAGSELGAEGTTSVLIAGIFEAGMTPEACKARGEEFVFAKSYIRLSLGGETATVLSEEQSPWSMMSVLQNLNAYWPALGESRQNALMEQIYTPYISAFQDDWGLFYMRYTYRDMTPEEAAVLEERRQTVLDYMRESTSILWTTDQELTYGLAARDNGTKLKIVPGRIYMGVPYAYAVGTQVSFLEYAVGQDEKGIYSITGVEQTALNYEAYGARVGNDCSGAVTNAWSQIGTSFTASRSAEMVEAKGVIPVGDYDFCPTINETGNITYTAIVNKTNGQQRMFEAYAQLLPADAVFYVTTSGGNHIRMVSEVHVVRNADGTIDGENSYMVMLEQTRGNQTSGKTKTVDGIGTVYVIGGVDVKYTFAKLFSGNYIPCTIKELRDPTPVEDTWVQDTQMEHTAENIFEGDILSNRYIDCVRITITDEEGNVVQASTGRARRRYNKDFQMTRFVTENPGALRGIVDVAKLESGKYRCTVTARLTIGEEYIVRDFTFEK